jgi:hypothetical protein
MSRLRAENKKLVRNPIAGQRPVKTNRSAIALAIEEGKKMMIFATLMMMICRAR